MAFWRPVDAAAFTGSLPRLALLGLAWWTLTLAGEWQLTDGPHRFAAGAVPFSLALVAVAGACALLVAAAIRRIDLLPRIAEAGLAATLVSEAALSGIHLAARRVLDSPPEVFAWLFVAGLVWSSLNWLRAGHVLRGESRRHGASGREHGRLFVASAAGGALYCVLAMAQPTLLETLPYAGGEVMPASIANEKHFHAHGAVLAEALGRLKHQRAGAIDTYFLAFAPYASEDVFVREARSLQRFMDQRFGTAGRSLALINHRAALGEAPLATATFLGEALQAIAARMDRDEDVLFLYVSTHGSEAGAWSMDNPPLRLEAMDAARLRVMLDAAGIRWRVLVISACYSGTALAPLSDPYTAVLTAADSHNPSFGCGNAFDFTWFADGLFNHGLAHTPLLREAFARASLWIAARERESGFAPSNPQIAIGGEMARRLPEIEAAWAAVRR
jgi:hypothetical protein